MKEFLKSPKKTAILGLVGSILMLSSFLVYFDLYSILNNLHTIGLITYFVIILIRMFNKKGNIKIANYILIGGYIIELFFMLGLNIKNITNILPYTLVFLIPILYFFNILLGKKNVVNNKVFAVTIILYTLIQVIAVMQTFNNGYFTTTYNIIYLVNFLSYVCIVPYFYNYYELLKEEK